MASDPGSGLRLTRFATDSMLRKGAVFAGRFRLDEYLGRGALGSVWGATDLQGVNGGGATRVALKVMTTCGPADAITEIRYCAEASFAAKLTGRNFARIMGYGVASETPYMAFELLDGETLDRHLQRVRRLSALQCLWLMKEMAEALGTAHAQGVVHGGLDPKSLFLSAQPGSTKPLLKVLDFGISRRTLLDPATTDASLFLGAHDYRSPEETPGAPPTPAHDLWSATVLVYRCLTGRVPFEPAAKKSALGAGRVAEPPSSFLPGLASAVDDFFRVALADDPRRRFQSASDLAAAFEAAVSGSISPLYRGREAQNDGVSFDPEVARASSPDDEAHATSPVRALEQFARLSQGGSPLFEHRLEQFETSSPPDLPTLLWGGPGTSSALPLRPPAPTDEARGPLRSTADARRIVSPRTTGRRPRRPMPSRNLRGSRLETTIPRHVLVVLALIGFLLAALAFALFFAALGLRH
ncbi:MAG: serine/threonine protein kinase [Polyangiaceae bacterium]|nr:serine/threonine protein kinase [Polyangiaceae bacterium]